MTIISYRNGVMAADSQLSNETFTLGTVRKIVRTPDGALAGACGEGNGECEQFLRWALGNRKRLPPRAIFTGKTACEGMLVRPDGVILYYDCPTPTTITSEYFSIGVGAQIATGALWKNGTAEEAVEAAIAHSPACGPPIEVLRLTPR